MPTRHRRHSPARWLVVPALFLAVIGYFAFAVIEGDYGMRSRAGLLAELQALRAEHARLVAERQALEARVERLRPFALDADLLDERARAKLDLARPDEVVLFHDRPGPE